MPFRGMSAMERKREFVAFAAAEGANVREQRLVLSWPPAAPTHCARNRCYAGGPSARGRRLLGALSPILSWTVGPWSTPDCRQSVRWAVEHACKSSLK